jgi:ABC-type transport system involved in cytochrome c biogenesis permease subunit
LLETGLLLVLIPWSAFWERNYFVEWSSTLGALLTNNYFRGAITGLGVLNVWAALAELSDMFASRKSAQLHPEIDQRSESGHQS